MATGGTGHTVVERTIPLGGDIELAIAEAGVGGAPLVLFHGFTGCKEDFEDWMVPLAERGWHVVAPDNRGHGGSSRPAGEASYSLEIFAADGLALLDALGWDRAVVLGHSMGGMFVQEMVLNAPERFAGMILMDTGHAAISIDGELLELGVGLARAGDLDTIADVLSNGDAEVLGTPAAERLARERPELNERHFANLRRLSHDMYAAMATELTRRPDRLPAFADVEGVPTLVVVGEQDEPFVAQSEALAATIPGATLAVVPDAGHCPQQEAPAAWWEVVGAFLDRLSAPSGAAVSGGVG